MTPQPRLPAPPRIGRLSTHFFDDRGAGQDGLPEVRKRIAAIKRGETPLSSPIR